MHVNDIEAKPSREVKVGDILTLRQGPVTRTLVVRDISSQRGGAPAAQLLYAETAESLTARVLQAEQRRLGQEPATAQTQGRPTKRDRRDIEKLGSKDWNQRWSASAD